MKYWRWVFLRYTPRKIVTISPIAKGFEILGILSKVKKIYRDSGAVPDAVTLTVAGDLDDICRMVDELQAIVDAEGMFTTYKSDRGSENTASAPAFKELATWQRIKTDKSRLLESIIRRDLKTEADIEDSY